jgi:hypothetical protein
MATDKPGHDGVNWTKRGPEVDCWPLKGEKFGESRIGLYLDFRNPLKSPKTANKSVTFGVMKDR